MPVTADAIARYEQASPLLLAMEAAQATPARLDTSRQAVEWNRERVHDEARLQMQRSWRFSFLQHWVLISEYLDPRRSRWLSQGGVDQPVPATSRSPVLIYEDVEDVIRAQVPIVGEYFPPVGPSFWPEGFSRLYVLTVAQMVEEFSLENCPPDVQPLWEGKQANLEREFIIRPRHRAEFRDPALRRGREGRRGAGPFHLPRGLLGLWQGLGAAALPARLYELPFIALRWAVNGNDPYGTSLPGMIAPGESCSCSRRPAAMPNCSRRWSGRR